MRSTARSRKQFFLGALTIVIVVAGLTLLVAALAPSGDGSLFQRVSGSGSHPSDATIAVIGYGIASAPADGATLQILVSADRTGYDIGRSLQPTPGATPGSGDVAAAVPIVDALMSAGVAREDVDVVSNPAFSSILCFGTQCATPFRVDVTLRQPQQAQVTKLVNAAGQAADDNNLRVQAVGAGYALSSCDTLRRQARQAAIADAQTQAQQQADLLHVRLGDLVAISDVPSSSASQPSGAGGCGTAPSPNSALSSANAGLTVPSFDPKLPVIASVAVQVSLTYAIA